METTPPVHFLLDHARLPAPETDSEGADLRPPEVNAAQNATTSGASGSRVAEDGGRAFGSQTPVVEFSATLRKLVEILDTMKEQQEDRQTGRAFQAATVETVQRV